MFWQTSQSDEDGLRVDVDLYMCNTVLDAFRTAGELTLGLCLHSMLKHVEPALFWLAWMPFLKLESCQSVAGKWQWVVHLLSEMSSAKLWLMPGLLLPKLFLPIPDAMSFNIAAWLQTVS